MKKNIAIVTINKASNSGGVERVVFYLSHILSQEYNIFLINKTNLNKFERIIIEKIFLGKFKEVLYTFFLNKKLNKLSKTINFDLVISNGFLSAFLSKKFKIINIFHGTMGGTIKNLKKHLSFQEYLWKKIIFFLEKKASKKGVNIAVSNDSEKEIKNLYKSDCFKTINNAIDVNFFKPIALEEKIKKRRILGLSNNDKVILYVASLEKRKGIDILISLAEKNQKYKFIILTTGGKKYYKNKLKKLKNVLIFEKIKYQELPFYYGISDIFFLPSRYEGFEMSTLEAGACGLTLCGYKVGALKTFFNNGICSEYILDLDKNVEDFEKCFIKIFSTKNRKNDIIRNYVKTNYSLEIFQKNWLKTIKEII